MFQSIENSLVKIQSLRIPESRKSILNTLRDYCQQQLNAGKELQLNFICTHNSRRSQFSQVWAQVAAYSYEIPLSSFSGGIEVTAFNERAIASLARFGFEISSDTSPNPQYSLSFANQAPPIAAFSKLYDDPVNPSEDFAAVMTCSDADENCPFIPGASARIPLRYEDPKAFDDTSQEALMYDKRSMQIASELFYVFNHLKKA
ncbi:protein-tyrosine-phosphatase [Roseivirga sp. E12]|uniref:protein-tyrosine-phosphatase n=1 Tax=Roseivirga sp. E12 TaxID=2819237 RepID=UPI001ABC5003|nr:protein-tyrosine-phosphatase [Roseivirga sp. E12]MBO3697408.1 protein-tyrosine-phosphatase [Roseivirga sp. E12]